MDKIFLPLYRFFRKRRWLLYTILSATSLFFIYFGLKVKYEEDISKLLPQTDEASESGLAFGNLRVKDKIFIIFNSDSTDCDAMSSWSEEFFNKLLERDSATHYIDNILYRLDDDMMIMGLDYALSHVPSFIDSSYYAVFDSLISPASIEEQMHENADLVFSDEDGSVSTMVGNDPLTLRKALIPAAMKLKEGLSSYAIVNGYFFTPDSTSAIGFIAPSFKSFDSKSGNRLIDMLEEEIKDFNETHENVEVLFHGAPVQSVFNSRQIKRDLLMTIGISLLLICILVGFCMKGRTTLLMLLTPVLYGTFFSLACVYFIKGSISLMAMGIGAIVLGVALSYCLHILTHYKYVTDPERVIKDQATPVCLGCLTTIGAFAGLFFTKSDLLKDFGLFASLAMIGTTLFALIFLPHFFNLKNNRKSEKAFALLNRINSYPMDRNKILIVFILLIFCISIFTSRSVVFDSDLKHIGYNEPDVMRSKEMYDSKVNNGLTSLYFASADKDLDNAIINNTAIQKVLDTLKQSGKIENYTRSSSLFINKAEQEKRIADWKAYWNKDKIKKLKREINTQALRNNLNPSMFDTFFTMLETDYEPDNLFESDVIPENLLCNFIEKSEEKYLVFTSVKMEESHRKEVCKAVAAQPGAVVIDPFFYTSDMVEVMNDDFNMILGISSLFVLLVLLISFKSLWIALIAYVPMSMSWIIVKGIMGLFGLEFNLINIIIATFIFGIGVDYSIFVMDGLIAGSKGKRPELLVYHKTAIVFSAIVLIVVVGSLIFARHPAINSIGITTLIGMTSTILITYTIEPLLYRLYLRLTRKKSLHGKE